MIAKAIIQTDEEVDYVRCPECGEFFWETEACFEEGFEGILECDHCGCLMNIVGAP